MSQDYFRIQAVLHDFYPQWKIVLDVEAELTLIELQQELDLLLRWPKRDFGYFTFGDSYVPLPPPETHHAFAEQAMAWYGDTQAQKGQTRLRELFGDSLDTEKSLVYVRVPDGLWDVELRPLKQIRLLDCDDAVSVSSDAPPAPEWYQLNDEKKGRQSAIMEEFGHILDGESFDNWRDSNPELASTVNEFFDEWKESSFNAFEWLCSTMGHTAARAQFPDLFDRLRRNFQESAARIKPDAAPDIEALKEVLRLWEAYRHVHDLHRQLGGVFTEMQQSLFRLDLPQASRYVDAYRSHLENPNPMVRLEERPGRNDPCWCGSGKKYKKCHLREDSFSDRQTHMP